MRLASLCLLTMASMLSAQHEQARDLEKSQPMPQHRPKLGLLPIDALRALQAGTQRTLGTQTAKSASPGALPGRGRYLAAIVVCADAGLDLPKLFDQNADNLLILSSPGPLLRSAEIEAIELAVRRHHLALCLVITHEGCEALNRAESGGQNRRLATSRSLAQQQGIGLEDAHGVMTARLLLQSSKQLGEAKTLGKFQVASLLLQTHGDSQQPTLKWRATFSRRPFDSARPRPLR